MLFGKMDSKEVKEHSAVVYHCSCIILPTIPDISLSLKKPKQYLRVPRRICKQTVIGTEE